MENPAAQATFAYKDLQQICEDFMYGVAVYNPQNNGKKFYFVDLNKAGEQFSNIKRENVIGKEIREVFPGAESMGLINALEEVYKTNKPKYLPTRNYEDQRLVMWTENYIFKIPSGEIMAVYEDKTNEKRFEKELNIVLETTNDGYFKWDLKKGKVFYSLKWKNMLGYQEDEIGESLDEWEDRLHPADKERALKAIFEFINSGGKKDLEISFRMEKKDGTYASILARGTLMLDQNGEPETIHGIHIDITENEKIRKELQSKIRELESLNNAMVGRELKMVELKKQLESMQNKLDKYER